MNSPGGRFTRMTCTACNGKGHFTRDVTFESDYFDEPTSYSFTRTEVCARCNGLGFRVVEHPDLIRCVCKKLFPSIAALAEHRKDCR
jgi:DnaJ-class molecular chaperone